MKEDRKTGTRSAHSPGHSLLCGMWLRGGVSWVFHRKLSAQLHAAIPTRKNTHKQLNCLSGPIFLCKPPEWFIPRFIFQKVCFCYKDQDQALVLCRNIPGLAESSLNHCPAPQDLDEFIWSSRKQLHDYQAQQNIKVGCPHHRLKKKSAFSLAKQPRNNISLGNLATLTTSDAWSPLWP